MEAVLDFYSQLADPQVPRICFDERPCPLLSELIVPLLMKPKYLGKIMNINGQVRLSSYLPMT